MFEILDALRGRSSERGFRKLNRLRPDLVAEQPEMLALLSDRTALAELPAGSLGREYLAFCERARALLPMASSKQATRSACVAAVAAVVTWSGSNVAAATVTTSGMW